MRDEQIERAVAVIVDECGARAPAGAGDAGLRRHIDEVAVTVVLQQHVVAEGGDVQIGVAVVVEVAGRHAHSVSRDAGAAPFGDVFEGAVAAVAIQAVSAAGSRRVRLEQS